MTSRDDRDAPPDPIDHLLRAHAPAALPDDGFVARTMRAVARADATPARVPRPAPLAVARALALEQRRYAAQTRLWRSALAGVAVGVVLLLVAMLSAPAGVVIDTALWSASTDIPPWAPMWAVMVVGAIWFAWNEFRTN